MIETPFAQQKIAEVERALATVVVGQQKTIRLVLAALISGGHVLIEDVPGVGKTTLVRSLAQCLGLSFNRIQGTTDLMPSEVTGVSVWEAHRGTFAFHPGPLMSEIVLIDEINRATPKTQSALLEAMEERQITVDGTTHVLPDPFFVLATQNPIDYEGTFPLTEAQRDRFFLTVNMGYPAGEDAEHLMDSWLSPEHQLAALRHATTVPPVLDNVELRRLFAVRSNIFLEAKVRDYILALGRATHAHPAIRLGLSPRAWLMLAQASQAQALFSGREFVTPDDVKAMLLPVAAHRLILNSRADMQGQTTADILTEIMQQTPAPSWTSQDGSKGYPSNPSRPSTPLLPGTH